MPNTTLVGPFPERNMFGEKSYATLQTKPYGAELKNSRVNQIEKVALFCKILPLDSMIACSIFSYLSKDT
jgi:hypothetical protein